MDLGDTVEDDNEAFNQNNTKTMIFLQHHLHKELKIEYLTIKDLFFLWQNLNEINDHQMIVILLKAR